MDLMTVKEACQELKISRRTLYRMIAEGVVPAPRKIHNFRKVYFIRKDIAKKVGQGLR
ncbi:hypothetical protein CDN99_04175 [Roseateles aquatilis]|uniref:Helix-turn-helix domain-containing protein n=1 Tax=Roseateles aquatilis TaxID=431061 RepID=A0A246JM28_9BURK|nr:helix-turn-helix domain-containing protein [Roseateles aquatilis]OWQ93662.1 hypothetical protein CDN99_04175 [Roseateles aquatilis]